MAWGPYTQFGYQNSPTIRLSVLSFGPRRKRKDIHSVLIQWNIIMPVQLSELFMVLGWCHSYACKQMILHILTYLKKNKKKSRRKTNRGDPRSNNSFWIPVVSTPWSFASDWVSNAGSAVCSKFSFYPFRLMRHIKNPTAYTWKSVCQENEICSPIFQ